jgi:hypothetical protein
MAALGAPLSWDSLHFQDDADARHLRALLQALPPKTEGWRHYPLQAGGNFLSEAWMKGQTNVLNESYMTSAGAAWYSVQSLHYSLPEAFGCLLSAGRNPDKDGLGVRLWYSSGGKTVVGDGCDLEFSLWKKGRLETRVPILVNSVPLPEPFELEGPAVTNDWRTDLAALGTVESFESTTRKRYDSASLRFRRALAEGRVKRRKYLQYQGNGIPPESTLVPLTDSEVDELRRYVTTRLDSWKRAVDEHGEEMFGLLQDVVPLAVLTD